MPTVLITGANRGIGLEFARQYAADGWRVIATCRNPAKAEALSAVEGDVTVKALDVDDPAAVRALAAELSGQAIDVLINNAGVYGPRPYTRDDVDLKAWGQVLHTNVMAPLTVAAAFAPHVLKSPTKALVTLSSRMGSIADNASTGDYIYRSSKAGVNAVMKSLANELGPDGAAVVMLHPGWVKTDMGGSGAQIDPEVSVAGMRTVIGGLKASDNGRFLNFDGTTVPW